MNRLGFCFLDRPSVARQIELVRKVENLGYESAWVTETRLARDAFSVLGAFAAVTKRVKLATGIVNTWTRGPALMAMTLATLDELAPGRIRLGFGVGDSGPLNLGVPRSSLHDLEAAVVAMRALLRGEETPGASRPLRLNYVQKRDTNPVPIYVAASGKRTQRLAGRVADAALISGIPQELSSAVAQVRAGEQEAGRQAGAVRILFWNTACVDPDREAARAAVRGSVARRAMNNFGRALREGTLPEEDREPLEKLLEAHQRGYLWDTGYTDLVPERWIDRLALAGTPEEVRGRIEHALADGADEISMILMSSRSAGARGSADQLTLFSESVIAPIRAAHPSPPE